MEKSFAQVLIILGVVLYVLSPVDFIPGPIDDVIVILLGHALSKKRIA